MENKVYSWNDFLELGFNYKLYGSMESEGTFTGTLDLKRWGSLKNCIVVYFTLDDGRKIITLVWLNTDYHGLKNTPIGSRLKLTFKKNEKGYINLIKVEE